MGKKTRRSPGSIEVKVTGWADAVVICRKCSKKLRGGFGQDGKQPLRGALREALRLAGRRNEVGLVEGGCLGICPKNAVTIFLGSAPGAFLIVGKGASVAALLDQDMSRVMP